MSVYSSPGAAHSQASAGAGQQLLLESFHAFYPVNPPPGQPVLWVAVLGAGCEAGLSLGKTAAC